MGRHRKLLVQTGLVLYVGGSILAGLSQSTSWLIACRVLIAAPLGLVALVAIALMREVPLGGRSGIDIARERATTHDQGVTP